MADTKSQVGKVAVHGGDAGSENPGSALNNSEPALAFNEAAKVRIGKIITDAVLPSCIRKPLRRLSSHRNGLS